MYVLASMQIGSSLERVGEISLYPSLSTKYEEDG